MILFQALIFLSTNSIAILIITTTGFLYQYSLGGRFSCFHDHYQQYNYCYYYDYQCYCCFHYLLLTKPQAAYFLFFTFTFIIANSATSPSSIAVLTIMHACTCYRSFILICTTYYYKLITLLLLQYRTYYRSPYSIACIYILSQSLLAVRTITVLNLFQQFLFVPSRLTRWEIFRPSVDVGEDQYKEEDPQQRLRQHVVYSTALRATE